MTANGRVLRKNLGNLCLLFSASLLLHLQHCDDDFFDFHGTGSSEKLPKEGIQQSKEHPLSQQSQQVFTAGTICAIGALTLATLPSYGRVCVQSRTVDASIRQHSRALSQGRRR